MPEQTSDNLEYPDRLAHIKSRMRNLRESAPGAMDAFTKLHMASMGDGVLDNKTKELIALAIGVCGHCSDCIAYHTHDALRAGATADEIAEVLGVAIMMGGGPALMYATRVVDAIEEFQAA